MNKYINNIINNIENIKIAEDAIQDLRYLIERHTMNRYSSSDREEYECLFHDENLLDVKLSIIEFEEIKYSLFFLILNYDQYTELIAKCIKVLFDKSLWPSICRCIYIYIDRDDAVCELIYAITNQSDESWEINSKIKSMFNYVYVNGGDQSKNVANQFLTDFMKI